MHVYLYPDGFRLAEPEDIESWEPERELGRESRDPNVRLFVALFTYNPAVMSPNPDISEDELQFEPGQIIQDMFYPDSQESVKTLLQVFPNPRGSFLVYGDQDADGFYRGEIDGRVGYVPSNMVSEIPVEDAELKYQLLQQGFLPEESPVYSIETSECSSVPDDVVVQRMVAIFDYDPWESSPNMDIEVTEDELPFRNGDIIYVFGDMDSDGFYYADLHGCRGLVPSNFLQPLPWD